MKFIKYILTIIVFSAFTLGCAKKDESVVQPDVNAISKPTGLTALAGAKNGEIYLSWTANSESDLIGYNIYGDNQGGGEFTFLASRSVNNYTATGLIAGGGYFFRVTALDNENNQSKPSSGVFCNAKGDSVAPAMPTGLVASAGGSAGRVNLNWTANTEPDLVKYEIYQFIGTDYSKINDTIDTTNNYLVNGLTTSTFCYFKIKAVDDSDNKSNFSAWSSVIVP